MSQVILFDLDGTLTESGEGITKCVQYALEKMGIVEENLDHLRCYIGPPLHASFMKFAGLDAEQAEQAIVYYRERYTTIGIYENKLYPMVKELLDVLKINDKILGVASSKPEIYVKQILQDFGIAEYFQVIVGSELDGARTKKEEVIEEALHRLHMENERDKVLMVGDKEHDVLGATACGIRCVGVTYGYGSREELEKAGAVYIADSVEDLGILASPNDEETTEYVESIRKIHKNNQPEMQTAVADENSEGYKEQEEMPKKKMKKRNPLLGMWNVLYPLLIYSGINVTVLICTTAFYAFRGGLGTDTYDPTQVASQVLESSIAQTLIIALITSVILYLFYRNDRKRRKQGSLGEGKDFIWAPPIIWFSVAILAIAFSQFLNDLIILTKLNEIFPGYQELQMQTMDGQPVLLMLLTVGIFAPVMEELLFRGLVYGRLKEWVKPVTAMIMTSVVFGLFHGNAVQFFYATVLGLVLAFVYEKTGTLMIPILFHVVANLWSLFGSVWWYRIVEVLPLKFVMGIIIEILLCVIPAYWLFAYKKNK